MNIFFAILILLFAYPSDLLAACATACTKTGTTYTCTDASYDCVSDAITAATAEDTINITDTGDNTWATEINLTKGLTIQCAPTAGTIRSAVGSSSTNYWITYTNASDEVFRVTGCKLDWSGTYGGILYSHEAAEALTLWTKIRFDNNTVTAAINRNFYFAGYIQGVVDSNTFNPNASTGSGPIQVFGRNYYSWNNETWSYGSDFNIFVEDNTFYTYGTLIAGGSGLRYVFRYNTITDPDSGDILSPLADVHGNTTGSHTSSFGAELYGNEIIMSGASYNKLINPRGGRVMAFFNKDTGSTAASSGSIPIWEEEPDVHNVTDTECADTEGETGCDTEGNPQHVSNSYFWNNFNSAGNRYNAAIQGHTGGPGGTVSFTSTTLVDTAKTFSGTVDDGPWNSLRITGGTGSGQDRGILSVTNSNHTANVTEWDVTPSTDSTYSYRYRHWSHVPVNENSEFWNYTASFNGTVGMGCGTAATMNAIETCTDGVGFWATDQGNCDSIAEYVGAGTTKKPIAGTLYKCASNEWVAHFTPYQYPHPLRNEAGGTAPTLSSGAPSGHVPYTGIATLSLSTDENAVCKYGTADVAYASLPNTFFTGAGTQSHSEEISVTPSTSYTYYVRCTDGTNPSLTGYAITFQTGKLVGVTRSGVKW